MYHEICQVRARQEAPWEQSSCSGMFCAALRRPFCVKLKSQLGSSSLVVFILLRIPRIVGESVFLAFHWMEQQRRDRKMWKKKSCSVVGGRGFDRCSRFCKPFLDQSSHGPTRQGWRMLRGRYFLAWEWTLLLFVGGPYQGVVSRCPWLLMFRRTQK